MGKSVPLVVRLPLGVYDEVKKMVDERGLASSYSGYCRQVITEDVKKYSEKTEEETIDSDEI